MPGCVDFLPSCGQGAAWFLARCAEVAGRWQYTGATAYWSATLCWLLAEYCTRWHFSPFQRALTDTALSRWNRPREVKRSVVPHGHCQLAYEPRRLGASFLLSHGVIPPHNLRCRSDLWGRAVSVLPGSGVVAKSQLWLCDLVQVILSAVLMTAYLPTSSHVVQWEWNVYKIVTQGICASHTRALSNSFYHSSNSSLPIIISSEVCGFCQVTLGQCMTQMWSGDFSRDSLLQVSATSQTGWPPGRPSAWWRQDVSN